MPLQEFALDATGTNVIQIFRATSGESVTVLFNRSIIGTISNWEELLAGREFPLKDSSVLKVQEINNQIQVFRNGQPLLPLSAAAPVLTTSNSLPIAPSQIFSFPLVSVTPRARTYAEVMSLSTGSNAASFYRARLPYAVGITLLTAAALILSFFLPWFAGQARTIFGTATNVSYTGFQMASSGVTIGGIVLPDGQPPTLIQPDTYNFPLLWLLLAMGIAQIILAALLFGEKVASRWISLSLRISFVIAFLIELIYLFVSLFASFSNARSQVSGYAPEVSVPYGFWVALLITIIGGSICSILISQLSWHWVLAQHEAEKAEQAAKGAKAKASLPTGISDVSLQ